LIPRTVPFGYIGRVTKMWIALSILAVAAALILAGCQATRAGYESAPYRIVRSDGKFQVRDYPALTVVETPLGGSRNGDDGSFMRLFRFITGSNEAKEKIAMTTPVFMSGSESNATMAFVMPAKLAGSQVPKPTDGSVKVRELEAGRFAVLRFSGGRNAKKEAQSLGRLQSWMKAQGLKELSSPIYGYFDPPWTPGFLRRNEVMLRTDAEQ
jgi:DNA gyrase inhibitor GyrI